MDNMIPILFFLTAFALSYFLLNIPSVPDVTAPIQDEIIIMQGVASVPQLDGTYKQVLVNIIPISVAEDNRLGYYDENKASVFVDFNHRKV